MNDHVIVSLAGRYPQLLLPIREGIKDTREYKDAVLRGIPVCNSPDFTMAQGDILTEEVTPAGTAEVLYLENRTDFEHALCALAYKCEPKEILPSVGASTIRGLINWEKIHRHKEEFLRDGGEEWNAEFKKFTAQKDNYLDTLILLSSGEYSAIPAERTGLSPKEWKEKSVTIRKYHELTHFVCRKMYPDDIESIRDEVVADMIGLLAAFGEYDTLLAKEFLGIKDGKCKENGRLLHYVEKEKISDAIITAETQISHFAELIQIAEWKSVFDIIPLCGYRLRNS